jgi:predicted transcriptional regulator
MTSVDEKTKLEVIRMIDRIKSKLVGTIYASELRGIRRKYIYKDISFSEFKNDLSKLKDYKNIIK